MRAVRALIHSHFSFAKLAVSLPCLRVRQNVESVPNTRIETPWGPMITLLGVADCLVSK